MAKVQLVLNAGSSSLKFQVFVDDGADVPNRIYRGLFEGLGTEPHFKVKDHEGAVVGEERWPGHGGFGFEEALAYLSDWLAAHRGGHQLTAVGHRVVHGGPNYSHAVRLTPEVIAELDALSPLAPLHQPRSMEPIRIIARRVPGLPQIAAFDTAFHHTQPEIGQLFAIPQAITDAGVKRYGFHGLSYAYLATQFPKVDARLATGRVVAAHLGSGASLCGYEAGRSVATTMGFSALDGLMMGTRCGTIDAGVVFYLQREMGMSAAEAEHFLYTKCGLLGVSGISNDMRELREKAEAEPGAQRAIDLFVYRINREFGSLVAALGGVDGFVFTAGIGENDAATRADVLNAIRWAGFELDEDANLIGAGKITRGSGPQAYVIPTDEEWTIVREMRALMSREDESRTSAA
ncbi:acetate/propionate family kinase [Xanthobacter autotrophicus DSM 431]|uniref:acetate/propionate family kinase n=1 Tax=Xanthobacter nonsaccharivorans TaxID=3119912 RepID=UPI0037287C45